MIGKLLNARYEIREQLSKKAGRRTFLAQDLHFQNLVIIKILLFEKDFQWDDLKLFEREAKTLQNLDHPAIPKYLDYFEVNDNQYNGFALVQTYIDAPSLEVLIRKGQKFVEIELIELAEKLLKILHYLHGQMPVVIHRDIKPSNILLANRSGNSIGDVYLVDFGSVQTVASKEIGTITIVGSYGYIPLEQFGGQAVPASDLYSLGMTIIYLATGTHPAEIPQVNGQTNFSTPQLSKQFQKWLDKMIQSYLNQRFSSAETAQKALKSFNENIINYPELRPKNTKVKIDFTNDQMVVLIPDEFANFDERLIFLIGLGFFVFICTTVLSFLGLMLGLLLLCLAPYLIWLSNQENFNQKKEDLFEKIFIDSKNLIVYDAQGDTKINILCSNISLLGYSPSYEFDSFWDDTGKKLNRGKVITKGELFIYAGATKYSITNLSPAEFWWIGQEISEFLNLELQIIYSTPKVPPESSCSGCGGC